MFELIPNVSLRYVKTPGELGDPDMILLPGSKNTIEDLLWLRQSGLENMILKEAYRGTIIFGICGGYQMLGEVLSDPHHVETGGMVKGMGLLPIDTVFSKQKQEAGSKEDFLSWMVICIRSQELPLKDMKFTWESLHSTAMQNR